MCLYLALTPILAQRGGGPKDGNFCRQDGGNSSSEEIANITIGQESLSNLIFPCVSDDSCPGWKDRVDGFKEMA